MRVAVNVKTVRGPWGGGNQFTAQVERHLRSRGHRVYHRLWPWIDRILLLAPRSSPNVTFGVEEIRRFKLRHPSVKCVHRINQTNLGRGTESVDPQLHHANEVADVTVFISHWVLDYFADRWFRRDRPHVVIHNGADASVFYPSSRTWDPSREPCRLVTHHWSSNWNKGFAVYQEVDRLIANGELRGFELTVIGRWPDTVTWRAATTLPALDAADLADQLRRQHIYLTAAVAEAGGMHHVEGAQCGLPLVYHESGGGIVEMCSRYGVGFKKNVLGAIETARSRYESLRERVLRQAPSGARMCGEYERVLLE